MRKAARRNLWIFLLMLIGGLLAIMNINRVERLIYPIDFADDIRVSAANNEIDPHLLAAIIRVESNYQVGVKSSKGAVGIMQIMPETARWITHQAGYTDVTEYDLLTRADVSIEAGAWYIHSLQQQFDHQQLLVIAAYNAGPGKVNSWLSSQKWNGDLQTVHQIPYEETRNYVRKVCYYYEKYKQVYPEL